MGTRTARSAAARAPGVLLIHGLSSTAWSWVSVARRLRAVRRTVALDLRGHGLSDAPTAGYDPVTLADDALAVADGSGLHATGTIVVVGHGFGAIVAAWTAARLGAACAGLVLVDGGPVARGWPEHAEPPCRCQRIGISVGQLVWLAHALPS